MVNEQIDKLAPRELDAVVKAVSAQGATNSD